MWLLKSDYIWSLVFNQMFIQKISCVMSEIVHMLVYEQHMSMNNSTRGHTRQLKLHPSSGYVR